MTSGGWAGSHSHGFTKKQRARILRRHPTCRHCGAPSTEADHIVPVAQGGTNDDTNGQGLCHPCHTAKTQAEAHAARTATPRQRPREPHPGLQGGG